MILRPSRRPIVFFGLFILFIVSIILHRSRFLFGLLFEGGFRDAIPLPSVSSNDTQLAPGLAQLIPKIIHQTYKTEDIPEHWRAGQQAVKDLHPDWEYMFWTDESAREFLQNHYAFFLPTYDAYPYPIQRADAIRYFLLYHYGGIYLDLDLTPYRPLTSLIQFPAFACTTAPTGISNDALGSIPNHPFYKLVINNLSVYAKSWGSGYITVMYTTGPLFLSATWIEYLNMGVKERVRLLIKGDTIGDSYGFFRNVQGGSWHGRDLGVILWMGRHWFFVTILGFIIGFSVTGALWMVFKVVFKGLGRFVGARTGGDEWDEKDWMRNDGETDKDDRDERFWSKS